MLEASKFSALVVNTIQGFSRKNRTPSSFLNFEIGVPRRSKLVYLEINFTLRAKFRPPLPVRELHYNATER